MRLIDVDALIVDASFYDDEVDKAGHGRFYYSVEQISNAPTVDAVEVTRCNECRFGYPRGGWTYNEYRCHKFPSDIFSGDHFCARAEPRPEEDE